MKDLDNIPALMADLGARAKSDAAQLATAAPEVKSKALNAAADAVWVRRAEIIAANAQDLEFGREKVERNVSKLISILRIFKSPYKHPTAKILFDTAILVQEQPEIDCVIIMLEEVELEY